eukprot:2565647-Prymnesium_polylepis.1
MRVAAELSCTANAKLRLRPKDPDADGAAQLCDTVRLRLGCRARTHAAVVKSCRARVAAARRMSD